MPPPSAADDYKKKKKKRKRETGESDGEQGIVLNACALSLCGSHCPKIPTDLVKYRRLPHNTLTPPKL